MIATTLIPLWLAIAMTAPMEGSTDRKTVEELMAVLNNAQFDGITEEAISRLEAAEEAFMLLAEVGKANPQAQAAAMAFLKAMSQRRLLLARHARVLSQFDPALAPRLVDPVGDPGNRDDRIWFLALALMKRNEGVTDAKDSIAIVTVLTKLLGRTGDSEIAARTRMVLITYGHDVENHGAWLVGQIDGRTDAGLAALDIACSVGIGSATQSLRRSVYRCLGDRNAEYSTNAAVALAISGSKDKEIIARVRQLYEQGKLPNTGSSAPLYYAYALSIMDSDRFRDYWRYITRSLGSDYGRTDGWAIDRFGISMSKASEKLVLEMTKDQDPAISKGARIAVDLLRLERRTQNW